MKKGYFGILDAIRNAFEHTDRVTTITHGDLNDVALSRQTIYPLVHIVNQGATFNDKTTDYVFAVSVMDIVDFTRDDIYDEETPFYGLDNAQDILHDLGITIELALDYLRRGENVSDLVRIADSASGTAFIMEGEAMVSGWNITISATSLNASISDGLC